MRKIGNIQKERKSFEFQSTTADYIVMIITCCYTKLERTFKINKHRKWQLKKLKKRFSIRT